MDDMLENHGSGDADDHHLIFEKYEMGRLLGQGTFAKVYYARDFATRESVAVKVIKIDKVLKEGLMEQILREIEIMRLVRHPNVVQLKEVMATKTKIFLVIEYVKGGELFAKIAKGRLKEDVARKYFQQLISAVDYCHSRGVSHRDLKPENLLLDENQDLKVSDFGLSALPEHLREDGMLHTQCGTPAYIAPEVLRNKGYDGAKADIWSCGVILYVLLSGFLPFKGDNVMGMYKKIFKAEYEFPAWFSLDSRRLILKLLVVDVSRRITVPAIMRSPWFFKGLKNSGGTREKPTGSPDPLLLRTPILIDEQGNNDESSESETPTGRSKSAPKFYNAFEFISAMSSRFDLSNMFEDDKQKSGSLFTSKSCASTIMHKLESQAKKLDFNIVCSDEKEYNLKMQRISEGRKGKLLVNAEVFEVAPEVAVVEFSKMAGDTLEYKKFEDDIRPGLQDIVWSWQGENSNKHV